MREIGAEPAFSLQGREVAVLVNVAGHCDVAAFAVGFDAEPPLGAARAGLWCACAPDVESGSAG